MIRMIQSTSAGHAKGYFSDALSKSDYYLNDQELQGRLCGKLSERIGISGIATKDNFFALCENRNPITNKPLTSRTKENRRTGYDINFHAPKSLSVLAALSKDDHLIKAFQNAVSETMKDIETDSKARVRKDERFEDRQTGELSWAEFTHQTARPVDGSVPDPHIHTHCFVFNATWDDVEKQFKAGEFGAIKQDMPYYQARFHKNLSDKLIDLGYQVRRTGKSFEIEGVPKNIIDHFSKRSNEIGEFAKEKGITEAKQLDKLGAMTRAKKQKSKSMAELKEEWKKQIRDHTKVTDEEMNAGIRFAAQKENKNISAKDCIDHSLSHSFERASVMPGRRLLEVAYKHAIGKISVKTDQITQKFENDERIIHVQEKSRTVCTTKEVLFEEKRMVGMARQGMGKFQPLYNSIPDLDLDQQQTEAVKHVLTTKHQVSIISGKAGTGKTKLLKKAVGLMERKGKKITVVAPTAEASRGVLAKEGFADAQTVAKLLVDQEMQDAVKSQIILVDEAGLLGTKDMSALLELAIRKNARLILVGDTRQHASVIRGDALRILNTVGGIKGAVVSKVYRQKNEEYKRAVEDLSNGQVGAAFEKLDTMGAIKTIDPLKPNDELIEDYIKLTKRGKSALIVSPTHEQGESVTVDLRQKLKQAGKLGKKELVATRLKNLNLTEAQKKDWRNFGTGQTIQFSQNVPKIKRGSVWSVKTVLENKIMIQNEKGEERQLPHQKPNTYDVYTKTEIALSKGDKVRITRNAFDDGEKRLNNGTTLEIAAISASGQITLKNEKSKSTYSLQKDFGHIAHAYCTTSHSAQGKTVDEVLISQPSSTFSATDAKQIYVSVSRGREAVTIYTDDHDALLDYASRMGDRKSAIELVGRKSHLENVQQRERERYLWENRLKKQVNDITKLKKDKGYEPTI